MSITVQGRVPWSDPSETASHITRRFQALERALAGGRDRFLSPTIPAFGAGSVTGGAGATAPGATPEEIPALPPEPLPGETVEDWERHFMVMGA